jgi:hypothetical protein
MNHFHVTLPSDSSKDTYPGNTTSRFTVKLPDRIDLDGDYEVGLSEFIYPHNWFNFNNSDERYWLGMKSDGEVIKKYYFNSGYYHDGTAFATDLNRQMARALYELMASSMRIRFTFNPMTLKMTIENPTRNWVTISDEFMKFLGFPNGWPTPPRTSMTATKMLDMNRGRNLMFIYCDAASHSIVGDVETPLLRVCNITGKDGEVIRTIFTHPHYIPLARHDFETIEINISDELGRPIPFMHGKSMITLHFKPRFMK